MVSGGSDSGRRTAALAAALLAITLNFLQPLVHAALMRGGGPAAAASLWGAFCQPSSGEDDGHDSAPTAVKDHECCLGLAHAPALAPPPTAFSVIERRIQPVHFTVAAEALAAVGIRDGPSQPRAPPFPV